MDLGRKDLNGVLPPTEIIQNPAAGTSALESHNEVEEGAAGWCGAGWGWLGEFHPSICNPQRRALTKRLSHGISSLRGGYKPGNTQFPPTWHLWQNQGYGSMLD